MADLDAGVAGQQLGIMLQAGVDLIGREHQ